MPQNNEAQKLLDSLEPKIAQREAQTLLQQLEGKITAREAELSQTENAGSGFADAAGRAVINNLLSAPKLLAAGAAGVQAPFSDKNFSQIFQEEQGKFPANMATDIEHLSAGARSLPSLLPQRGTRTLKGGTTPQPMMERFNNSFTGEFDEIKTEEERLANKFPKATQAGEIGGDVATLFGARAPFLKSINKADAYLAGKKFASAIDNPGILGEAGNVVRAVVDSSPMRSLLRGTGRAGEAGAEAFILEALDGDDPLRVAAWTAGGQAVSSGLIKASKGMVSGGIMGTGAKLAMAGGAYFGLLQTLREGTPFTSDGVLPTISDSFEHVAYLMIAGGVATAIGGGRIRPEEAKNIPRLAEFISTIPRATTISLVTSYMGATPDEQQTIDATLQSLQEDPDFFGPELSEKILDAIEKGNLVEALREPQ